MTMQYPPSLDRRFPPIGNSFLPKSITEEFADEKQAPLKRASRFKSSPGVYPLNDVQVVTKGKGMLECDAPETSPTEFDVANLWDDLPPVSDSIDGDDPQALASSVSDSKLCADETVATASLPSKVDSCDVGSFMAAERYSARVQQQSGDVVSLYEQSRALAEKVQQSVLTSQERRAKRFSAEAGEPAKTMPAATLPVLLGCEAQCAISPKGTSVQADVAKPAQSIAALQKDSLILAKRAHQSFLASQKRRAGRHASASSESGDPSAKVFPALLGQCKSNPLDSMKTTRDGEHSVDEPPQDGVVMTERPISVSAERHQVNSFPVLLGKSAASADDLDANCKAEKAFGAAQQVTKSQAPLSVYLILLLSALLFSCSLGGRLYRS